MIKLVVSDFDDTLCLTEQIWFAAENYTASLLRLPPLSREVHKATWGLPFKDALLKRFPSADVETFIKEHKKVAEQLIKEKKVDIVPDENLQVLDQLLQMGKKLAVLTSRSQNEVEHLLTADHPINLRFEKIYHTDNSDFVKPDPRVFKKVLQDFKVQPHETVYIGDTVGDGIAAKGAGLHFIAILASGLKTKEDFKDIAVDYFVESFPQILSYIQKY